MALIVSKRVRLFRKKKDRSNYSTNEFLMFLLFGSIGISMHCVREEHSAVNMNLHYLENGTVMLNFIYRKELFFLPLGFALKV